MQKGRFRSIGAARGGFQHIQLAAAQLKHRLDKGRHFGEAQPTKQGVVLHKRGARVEPQSDALGARELVDAELRELFANLLSLLVKIG